MTVTFIKPFANTNYYFSNRVSSERKVASGWDGGSLDEVVASRKVNRVELTTDGIGNTKNHPGLRWAAWGYSTPPTAADWAENLNTSTYKRYIKY